MKDFIGKKVKYVMLIIILGVLFSVLNKNNSPNVHYVFSYPNLTQVKLDEQSQKKIYSYLSKLDYDENFDITNYEPTYGEGNRTLEIRFQDKDGYHIWFLNGRLTEHKLYPSNSREEIIQYKLDDGETFEYLMEFYK